MTHADLLQQLLPAVSYDSAGGRVLLAQLYADGRVLDRVQVSAGTLLTESDPCTCYLTLPDWERIAGLPDTCDGSTVLNLEARRRRLASRLIGRGGSSSVWIADYLSSLGYAIVGVDEFSLANCSGDCNQSVLDSAWLFAFRINISGGLPISYSSCIGGCDDALAVWDAGGLTCRIDKVKPAHTLAILNFL